MGRKTDILRATASLGAFLALVASLSEHASEPAHSFAAELETGWATYYTAESCQREGTSGVWTASGEKYREQSMTCALPHRRFGQTYRVQSLKTGRSVAVRHNDFGPSEKCRRRGVVVDLTPRAFSELGHPLSEGRIKVSVVEIE